MSARVTGLAQLRLSLGRIGGRLEAALAEGLLEAGETLKERSQQLVPVETGELRDSAFVRQDRRGRRPAVEVGYDAEHALTVPEDLDAEHAPGESSKFLERPARSLRRKLAAQLARKLRGVRP